MDSSSTASPPHAARDADGNVTTARDLDWYPNVSAM